MFEWMHTAEDARKELDERLEAYKREEYPDDSSWNDVELLRLSPLSDEEKLKYAAKMAPYIYTEDAALHFENIVTNNGNNIPDDLVQPMFDALRPFVARNDRSPYDRGLPLSNMYGHIRTLGKICGKDKTPNFHENVLSLVQAEVSSDQWRKRGTFPKSNRLKILTEIVKKAPHLAGSVYETFQALRKKYDNKNATEFYSDEHYRYPYEIVQGKLVSELISAMDPKKDEEALRFLKPYHRQLEEKAWQNTLNAYKDDKRYHNYLAEYAEAFPQQFDKAYTVFKKELQAAPFDQQLSNKQHEVYDKFVQLCEKEPDKYKEIEKDRNDFLLMERKVIKDRSTRTSTY